jgi:hypothetical protein
MANRLPFPVHRSCLPGLILICSLVAPDVSGQSHGEHTSILADSLDWHRYFPLAVGNAWEYETSPGPAGGYYRVTIVADSVVGDRRYFAMVGSGSAPTDTVYIRYDTLAYVVVVPDIDADTTGEEVAAMKCFEVDEIPWRQCYAADVGFLGGESLHWSTLTYAKIGDVEYGESRFTGTATGLPRVDPVVSLFPNPATGSITLEYSMAAAGPVSIEVFDLLGRKVRTFAAESSGSATEAVLDVSGLPPGVYHVRLTETSGAASFRSFIITR